MLLLFTSFRPNRTHPKTDLHDPTGPDYEDPEEPDHIGHQHDIHVRSREQGQGLCH